MLPGFRFDPTDEELAGHYLYKKLTGKPFAAAGMIVSDCQLYGREEPWEVWKRFGGDERTDGKGNWHREDSGKIFEVTARADFDCRIKIEATKKRFKYKNRNSSHHCGWILFEYSLPDLNRELVLCCLRKNGSKTGEKNKGKRKIDDCEGGEVVNCEMVITGNKRIKANDNEAESYYNQIRANGDDDCLVIASDFDDQMGTEFWANNQVEEQQENSTMLPGFRFDPTDEELAGHYLYKKLTGKPFVAECNDIWAPGGDECLTVGADRDEPMGTEFSVEELLDNANTFEFDQIDYR
ncbi:NAC transcription factor 47-like [Jatropha curcas]|uniref:NAC transcription factor 47-like n=1 Tax=Jatropha curcas TaxID=180498 RepID=UPI0018954288|nr:NAC transcription factor 47-like [Jatropha curcas]